MNRYWVIAQVLGFVLFLMMVYHLMENGKVHHRKYLTTAFAGRIDTIYRYDRNRPVVSLSGRQMTIEERSHGFSTYLSIGDSIIKVSGTEALVTYRVVPGTSGRRIQVSVWGDAPNNKLGYWGLTDRYYIRGGLVQDSLTRH
jgi:hypothetical protein